MSDYPNVLEEALHTVRATAYAARVHHATGTLEHRDAAAAAVRAVRVAFTAGASLTELAAAAETTPAVIALALELE